MDAGFIYLLITLSEWHWFCPLICLFTIRCKDPQTWHRPCCSKEKKKEKEITSRSALTQFCRQGQLITLQTHASWLMPFKNWLSPQPACFKPPPPLVSLLTLLWFPPICASDEHPGAPALFDVWADPALRDCGPCAVSMKAIKNLNLCHNQNRPCIHFFFNPSSWQNCKGAVLDCPHWCLHSKRQSPCQSVHWLN